jgi:putative transposase
MFHVMGYFDVSGRRICRALSQPRSTQRYLPRVRNGEALLTERMIELETKYGRYGYRRITALLQREDFQINHKRVERLWRREGLKVPQKQPKRKWRNEYNQFRPHSSLNYQPPDPVTIKPKVGILT